MVGTEYKWLGPAALPRWDLALRAGYWFSESPVPDRAYNPVVPDSNNHALSVGLGLTCHRGGQFFHLIPCGSETKTWWTPKGLGLDLAYKALLYEPRTVSGNANPVAVPGAIDGTYRTTFHIGSVNVRMDF
jgi:long-chain fatty acid transport protein